MERMNKFTTRLSSCFVLTVVVLLLNQPQTSEAKRSTANQRVCSGSSMKLTSTHGENAKSRYLSYVKEYKNCTIIETNLEIVFLNPGNQSSNDTFDMSFLESIEEVYGYVLIAYAHVDEIPLTNLRVIHGNTLYSPAGSSAGSSGYSLYVSYNYLQGSTRTGLKELRLNSLRDILKGDISIFGNNLLCHADTINWRDILSNLSSKLHIGPQESSPQRQCLEPCDASCYQNLTGSTHCWAAGSGNCQQFTRLTCSNNCNGMCFGPGAGECCSEECAGGCLGSRSACWTCKNFVEDGVCVKQCQPAQIYNSNAERWEPNPKVKYASSTQCVDKCDDHMYVKDGACVRECGEGQSPSPDGRNLCVHCGANCPKICNGGEITNETIRGYVNCQLIQGKLIFYSHEFAINKSTNRSSLAVDDLSVFESVEEITECLQIDGSHSQLKSLSFLKKLKRIRGQRLCGSRKEFALQIVNTQLESVGLTSLETVAKGSVSIFNNPELTELNLPSLKRISNTIMLHTNPKLCYYKSINWTAMARVYMVANGEETGLCANESRACSDQCLYGCWGEGDSNCVDCLNYRYGRKCLPSCDHLPGLFKVEQNETKLCKNCHSECTGGCTGENSDQCTRCSHYKDGLHCVAKCPENKYPDLMSECQFCSQNCKDGCLGPSSLLSKNGCNTCKRLLELENGEYECGPYNESCPDGYFEHKIPEPTVTRSTKQMELVATCRRCHSECSKCDYTGPNCIECKHFREGLTCVESCSSGFYQDNASMLCLKCDRQCVECNGPTNHDCLGCKYFKVYDEDIPLAELKRKYNESNIDWNDFSEKSTLLNMSGQNQQFFCEDSCPHFVPEKNKDICITEDKAKQLASKGNFGRDDSNRTLMAIGGAGGFLLVALFVGMVVYGRVKRTKRERERKKAELLGLQTLQASSPTSYTPDLAYLRLINETELRRGKTIGSGAFGTVYQGIWTPNDEKIKIPVAIKVMKKGPDTAGINSELLEEARIMASVRHENCIRILAVSLTAELMLITQLMPNGSLLDYIRKYRDRVGSNALLTWSRQIANGMQYLEQLGIVHRDLAARNVLVEGPQVVKITDFGLAKLVNDKDYYLADGGKVPLKWLSLESIQHRVFTHKSDVWSYGVTLWEIFTYGQRPYDTVPAKNLCDLLESGERLPQPKICTIDVYMIMIKCWMVDAQERPSFKELVNTFTEFANDPGRYLVIQEEDKMQLPTAEQNLREMLRGLSVLEEEDKDQIVTADEYLRPHDFILDHLAMTNARADYSNFSDSSGSPMLSPSDSTKFFPDLDFNLRGADPAHRSEISRKQSQRYCPNPSREPLLSSVHSSIISENQVPPEHLKSAGGYAQQTERKMIDEADYLQPRSSMKPKYIDLVSCGNPDLETEDHETAVKLPFDYINNNPKANALENPEYYDGKYINSLA